MWYLIATQADNFKKTGCYNLYCSGFVQTHKGKYLGARIDKTSIYGGPTVEIAISITQVMFIPYNSYFCNIRHDINLLTNVNIYFRIHKHKIGG